MSDVGSRAQALELARRLIMDVLWKTANIEVDGITFPDTQEIVEGRAPAGMSVHDIVTVNNIKHAFQFLFDQVDYPVDWQTIAQYNRLLRTGLASDAGEIRSIPVRISGTSWQPTVPVYDDIREQLDTVLALSDPQELATQLFAVIARGQWFTDGNKRTALLAANHALIHAGMGILTIDPDLKRDFTTRLLSFYEHNTIADITSWLRYYAIGHVPSGLTLAAQTQAHELDAQQVTPQVSTAHHHRRHVR